MDNWHDTYSRQVFSRPEATADLLRFTFPADVIARLDLSSLQLVDGRFGDEHLGPEIETDFLWELRSTAGTPVLVYLLFEHQSTVDPWMALRMLRYRVRIWDAYPRKPDALLPAILPLVLYHGEQPWTAALDVAELITPLDDSTQVHAAYRVLDISSWADAQILGL